MTPIPLTRETAAVARHVIWFEPPEQALRDPVRFMAYALTYADAAEMTTLRRYISDADLLEVLDRAPAGIIDPRSWSYWNAVVGRWPAPPLPARTLPPV
ncbi:MAG: hypothetical protein HY060_22865 [Proteobacteria bacterium]|nr:hypothetical protein [Pseudomonadota bacterium]